MKKIVNKPRLLVIISIILLVISFIYTFNTHFIIGSLLDFTTSGCLVLLLYFILIISKKHINLTAMNTIVFINFVVVLLIRCGYVVYLRYISLSLLLSNYIPLFIVVVIYLGIIFYSKNKSIIKPNLISIICLLVYIACLIGSIINVSTYGITKFEVAIRYIIETLYYIPIILYFRLYALNKLEKMEVKNER